MSDSDWSDPFAEDEAAREREERRAERERRRREEDAREGLGERVRQELAGEPAQAPEPSAARDQPPVASPQAPVRHFATGRRSASEVVRRRRTIALVAVGLVIAAVAVVGAVVSRNGDDSAPAVGAGRKTISVTIPEGDTRSQVARITRQAGLEGDYERATRSSDAIDLKDFGAARAENLEGFLFPDTYELFKGDTVHSLVRKQLDAFESNVSGIDMSYAESKNLSVYDVVIIASMIEREIAVAEERKLAASVIYNRLEANNPLGIDATIRFEDQNYDEPLLESRLNEETPYNTHTYAGLPPGPIGNPGLASLEAAANPAETDLFYYVIKPGTCNEHTFVETDAEFAEAQAEYQAALEAEGGSPTDC